MQDCDDAVERAVLSDSINNHSVIQSWESTHE